MQGIIAKKIQSIDRFKIKSRGVLKRFWENLILKTWEIQDMFVWSNVHNTCVLYLPRTHMEVAMNIVFVRESRGLSGLIIALYLHSEKANIKIILLINKRQYLIKSLQTTCGR
jgi:hypothetical protein